MNICINKSPTYPQLYSFKCFFLAACCKKKKTTTRSRCQASPRLPNGGPDSLSACQFVSLLFSLLFLGGFTRFRALCESLASVYVCVWESCNCVCNCLLSNASATATATTLWQQLQRRATHDSEEDVFI